MAPEKLAHANGFSCRTPGAIRYDANGWRRWCIDCGAEVDEQAYHPDGCDVGWMLRIALIAVIVVPIALVAYLMIARPQ